jgi:hypothetical protein
VQEKAWDVLAACIVSASITAGHSACRVNIRRR